MWWGENMDFTFIKKNIKFDEKYVFITFYSMHIVMLFCPNKIRCGL